VSKKELETQVERLQKVNSALRAKGREAGRAAKTASARIAALEEVVDQLRKQLAGQARASAWPSGRVIDPGDAVPPGVAVSDPAALDDEAEQARDNL
jgi:hypothetical protein